MDENSLERKRVYQEFKKLFKFGHPEFYDLILKMAEVHEIKNKGYGIGHPLGNFLECERFGIPAWKGCLVRMCFDKETEILTEGGWKNFKDLRLSDKVASLQDGKLIFVQPLEVQSFNYSGRMYHLRTRSVDLKVTPEHRLYLRPHNSKFKFIKPEQAKKLQSFEVAIGCDWEGKESDKSKDFFKFLGFWIAEGYTRGRSVVRITQKPSNQHWIIKLVKRLGFKPNISGKEIYFSSKELVTYLNKFGNRSYNRHIIKEVKDLKKELLLSFLEGYLKGDGWRTSTGTWHTSTASKQLADDLMEIGLKAGFAPKIRGEGRMIYKGRTHKTRPSYQLVFSKLLTPQIQKRNKPYEEWEWYEGKVYCCSVPSGVILVRRNGKPVWSGNSDKWSRACNLASKMYDAQYQDAVSLEGIEDTLLDLANYAILCIILLRREKQNATS